MQHSLKDKLSLFDPTLPLERASTPPSLWYQDPEIYHHEQATVFAQSWLAVGRLEQVQESGSYFTFEVGNEPFVIVRDQDDTLRAFHDVCQHRGARVTDASEGNATRFRCRYHGWTYDLTGKLKGTPDIGPVECFEREQIGLQALKVETWGPFIFVTAETTTIPLREYLGPIPETLDPLHLDRLHFVGRREYEVACNWKVFVDNYLDGGYHVPTVHPALGGMTDFSRYRTEIGEWASVQIGPLNSGNLNPASQTVSASRKGEYGYYAWVHPNFMLNAYEGYLDLNWVLPMSVDSTRVVFEFFLDRPRTPETEAEIEQSIAVAHQIQMEDVAISEEVQRGLGSRAFDVGRYTVKREGPVYEFHRLLARQLQSG